MPTPSLLDTATGLQNGDVASLSASYTVPGTGSNKTFVCIFLGRVSGATVTAATLNGVALVNKGDNGSTVQLARVYTLNSPTSGTLSVTLSGNARFGLIYFTLQDVDQTTPTRTGAGAFNDGSGGNALATGSFTTVVGDLVIGGAMSRTEVAADFTIPSGATSLLSTLTIDPTFPPAQIGTNASSIVATGTSTNLTWSTPNATPKAVFALPFVGASGGGGATINDHNFNKVRGIGSGVARGVRYAPHHPISIEAYARERERDLRAFIAKVQRAA